MSYLTKKNIADIYPLSPMQQGMLFHSLYDPKASLYFEQFNFIIEGELNIKALEQAWNNLIQAYPIFRTVFNWKDAEKTVQIVLKERPIHLDVHDMSSFDGETQERRIREFLLKDRQNSFDMAKGPLIRLNLLQLSKDKYHFVWSYHHILLDGWCLSIIMQDLFLSYTALSNNTTPPRLSRPPYKSYISWLQKQDTAKANQFWADYLNGFEASTPLPRDRKGQFGEIKADEKSLELSEELTGKLEEFAKKQRTTLSMVIQAVWALLLSRYSNNEDVVFGLTMSGRPPRLKRSEEIVGLFINTLPIRAIIDENKSFTEFLDTFSKSSLDVMEYDFSFLPDIKAASPVSHQDSLFDSIFVFENYPLDSNGISVGSDLMIRGVIPEETTNFDLTVVGMPGKNLCIRIIYNSVVFDDDTIDRMISHLSQIITKIPDKAIHPMREMDILGEGEKRELLFDFNDSRVDFPKEKCTHELFEEQAALFPDKEALVFGDEAMTYAELNEKANRIARYLREHGVTRGTYVAIMVERSFDMLIGVLGIMKAGGAYVPIESEYPNARIIYMLNEIKAPVIIVHESLIEDIPDFKGELLSLDRFWEQSAGTDSANLDNINEPDDVAYVIYTSGSTGKPKGVMVPHVGISRLVINTNYTEITPEDRFLQVATFAFDAATMEFWGPLLNGGTLVLASKNDVLSPDSLADLLLDYDITILFITTVIFNQLVDTRPDGIAKLKALLNGGEAHSLSHMREAIKHTKKGALVHVYGPTENTTYSTYYPVNEIVQDTTSIPIGFPLANSTVYILDKYLKPVPIGIPGEIYLGGLGLAKGYLNDPEKTAAAFVTNPVKDIDEQVLYKTGDLGKWLPDGSVDFIGRIDHQVKIRGHRIELGEIEAALREHERISDCVVIVKDYKDGNKLLLAYYVSEKEIPIDELRASLKENLPDYMVPNFFTHLDEIPLNQNGKVDKAALPDLQGVRPEMATEYIAPSSEIQCKVAEIWKVVLGIDDVGIHDNFFDLGGHSLKATQVVSRIKKDFETDLPIRALFEFPTIKGLEDAIVKDRSIPSEFKEIPLVQEAESHELSHAQKRLWVLDKLIPDSSAYNVHGDVLLEGELDIEAVKGALQLVVNRHESLRTVFPEGDDKPVQAVKDQFSVTLAVKDISDISEQDIYLEQAIEQEALKPFKLSKGPLFRVIMLKLAPQRHMLLLTMHHIISDGWSIGILLQEAAIAYDAIVHSRKPELAELKIQYKDFSAWQADLLRNDTLKEQENYWVGKLKGPLPILELPGDRPRPPIQTNNGAMHRFILDSNLSSGIRKLADKQNVTLYMLLLTSFGALLNRLSSQEDITIGSPIAGRNHPDIEGLIGFFVNTLAMRLDLSNNPDFISLLKQVKNTCLESYANQDYPFDSLIDILHPIRDTSRTPIFNVMLVFQNAADNLKEADFGSLKFKDVTRDRKVAKFDITLFAVESDTCIEMVLEYNTDLFNRETAKRYSDYFRNLMQHIVDSPEGLISGYEFIGKSEKETLIKRFNATEAQYPDEKLMHELIEEQADANSDRVALIFEQERISFGEMEQKANQLAHYLRSLGIGPDKPVGILMDRSFDLVIGVLGILKAGGAYVPIDSEYPKARIEYMLGDCGADLILTHTAMLEKLPAYSGKILCLDRDRQAVEEMPEKRPAPVNNSRDLVYIVYTSGSTGNPKGIEIEHRGLVNYITWAVKYYDIEDHGSFPLYTSMSFDLTVTSIFAPLAAGESIHIQPVGLDPATLVESVVKSRECDIAKLTPAHLEMVDRLTDDGLVIPEKLNRFVLGGEALSAKTSRSIFKKSPQFTFYNEYGPAETVVGCIVYKFNALDPECTNVLIGKPISNTKIYILDNNLNLVPMGVPGEICISSPGVARGYLNKDDVTARSFVKNPLNPEDRIYRTGDLGKWLPDGNIEYLGRVDHQVKIRGHRIELGEVEAMLGRYKAIHDCVVVDRDDNSGARHLVGYYVADQEISSSDIKTFLKETLPDYMVPARLIPLEALPLTPNGKVDRDALPEMDGVRPEMESEYVAPRNELEQILAEVWIQVLGLDKVGIYDNFFDLGGDSIISLQVVGKLKKRGYQIRPSDMFEYQTIAAIVPVVEVSRIITAEQGDVVGDAPLTPIQRWFFDLNLSNENHFNQSSLFRSKERIDEDALGKSLKALINHHDILRTRYSNEISVFMPSSDKFDFIVKTVKDEDEFQNEVRAIFKSFDIKDGPLFGAGLFHKGDADYLLLAAHHLVIDGVSWRILLEDLLTGYGAAISGLENTLPDKTTSYKEWASKVETYAGVGDFSDESVYWKKELADDLPNVKVDHDLGPNNMGSSETLSMELSREKTAHLLKDAHKAYNTDVNELLVSAFMRTLAQWSGHDDVLFDLEGHGREDLIDEVDISRTAGWFTTIFPVRLHAGIATDLASQIKYVKEKLRSIPHRGFNYTILKYMSGNNLIINSGISFNYLGQFSFSEFDDSFSIVPSDVSMIMDENNLRANLIDVVCMVTDGIFKVDIIYSRNRHTENSVGMLSEGFRTELANVISHCLDPESFDITPSDFDLLEMDQDELDSIYD